MDRLPHRFRAPLRVAASASIDRPTPIRSPGARLVAVLAAVLAATALASLASCTGTRLVVDVVPASDELVETTVIRDEQRPSVSTRVAMLDVRGALVDAGDRSLLRRRENPVDAFAEGLRKAADDQRVRAVLVRIDSPGGTVTASEIMHGELRRFRERTGKPVVVLMGTVAASGGYYIACGADEIVARPSTITGSIGVIMQTVDVSGGLGRIGVRTDAITSGSSKAAGSPLQPLGPEHRAIFQGIVDEFFEDFLAVVRAGRPGLAEPDLAAVTDGRVVTGARAADLGLVDHVGDLHLAYERARTLAGVEHARLVKYHRPQVQVGSPYSAHAAHASAADPAGRALLEITVGPAAFGPAGAAWQFLYLWDPTVW